MWVIKIGGSLLGSEELIHWLDVFARYGDGKVILVPGGGIFADAVRRAQKQVNLSDSAAHRMAVMAMDQYGILMADLNPSLVTAESELEIAERGWQHRAIVWLPSKMVISDDKIPKSWDVTSDSLAAWLASKLNAEQLILIKSQPPLTRQMSIEHLIKENIVDKDFGDFTVGQRFHTWILGKDDYFAFSSGISQETMHRVGMKVRCAWN